MYLSYKYIRDEETGITNPIDCFRLYFGVRGKWHVSIDPFWAEEWKPFWMFFKGYNKHRKMKYYLWTIGWLIGWMFSIRIFEE